jgi:predicted transposase YdaD
MPHVPDATTKYAFDLHPRPWLALAGLPVPPTDAGVTVVDTTLSTVSMTADKLVRVDDGVSPYLAHVEFQTSRDVDFNRRMLRYNVWAGDTYGLPVRSVAYLFRSQVGRGSVGRVYERHDDQSLLEFRFRVIRLWELPVEPLLTGPMGTLPLAVLSSVDDAAVPAVAERVRRRFDAELPRAEAREMAEVVRVFMGLRWNADDVEAIMGTFADLLEDSTTYQATLRKGEARGLAKGKAEGKAEGAAEALQGMLLAQGEICFGRPTDEVVQRIRAVTDLPQLQAWTTRLLAADGWDALLKE